MSVAVVRGDARCLPLPDGCVDLIVTSPPYFGLRSYMDGGAHYAGQIGSEGTPAEWLAALVAATAEWVRVLKPSGSMFVNLGDKYASGGRGTYDRNDKGINGRAGDGERGAAIRPRDGFPEKSLLGLPWRYALACTDQLGLILRRDIVWAKPNGLPESVTDRCRSSHEYVFHLVRQPRYYAAVDEIREPHTGTARPRRKDGGPSPKQAAGDRDTMRWTRWLESDSNPLGKLPGSVWDIPSQPLQVPAHLGVDHFAAFPMELPRRCVLGWSPPGVCTGCGEGRRPVSVGEYDLEGRTTNGPKSLLRRFENSTSLDVRAVKRTTITGYACACPQPDAPTRPAVVLDPFAGTGTTMLVASALGRTGIGVDRSADYCRLAAWRTRDPAERAKAMQVPKPPPIPDGQTALFTL